MAHGLVDEWFIIGGGLACGRARPLGTLTDKTPWHVDGGNSRDVDDGFWHVGRHHRFGISTTTPLAHRRRQSSLACRQRILFCMSTGTIFFACGRRQSCLACRQEQPFLHVDGDNLVWHVDGNHFFACRRRQSCLACRREQPFLHVNGDNLLWHVDGSIFLHVDGSNIFCMSTETILFWHVDGDNPLGMSTVVLACRRVVSRHHRQLHELHGQPCHPAQTPGFFGVPS